MERSLEIAGEALSRVRKSEPEILDRLPDSHIVIGMRNRISHGYDAIDDETIWASAKYDVPTLATEIRILLDEDGRAP